MGMTFSKNDVDQATGLYQKTIKLEGLPALYDYKITEVYSGNYTGSTPVIAYDSTRGVWTATIDNSHSGYTPGSGVVNKYKDGTVTQEGLTSGGDANAGGEGN